MLPRYPTTHAPVIILHPRADITIGVFNFFSRLRRDLPSRRNPALTGPPFATSAPPLGARLAAQDASSR